MCFHDCAVADVAWTFDVGERHDRGMFPDHHRPMLCVDDHGWEDARVLANQNLTRRDKVRAGRSLCRTSLRRTACCTFSSLSDQPFQVCAEAALKAAHHLPYIVDCGDLRCCSGECRYILESRPATAMIKVDIRRNKRPT